MIYMLDTNICIYIIRKKPVHVFERFQQQDIGNISISSITLAELEFGIEKSSKKDQNRIALAEFLAPIEILPFHDSAARIYGIIRNELQSKGALIGPYDLLIAAHAIACNATLITNNMKEFIKIPNLLCENWVL